jgi:hypothetical protein
MPNPIVFGGNKTCLVCGIKSKPVLCKKCYEKAKRQQPNWCSKHRVFHKIENKYKSCSKKGTPMPNPDVRGEIELALCELIGLPGTFKPNEYGQKKIDEALSAILSIIQEVIPKGKERESFLSKAQKGGYQYDGNAYMAGNHDGYDKGYNQAISELKQKLGVK